MGRKSGRPAYAGKTTASSYVVDKITWLKLGAAERRTGKSRSDIIQHCLRTRDTVDTVSREALERLAMTSAA